MDANEAINVTTIQLTNYKGLYLPPRDYMSCQPLTEEWELRIPNLHKYNNELSVLMNEAKKNDNKLPVRFPLIYLPFHHQFIKNKESSESNELRIFKMTKNGFKAMSDLAKKSQNRNRPGSAFKHSESSLVNLQPVYKQIFKEDIGISNKAADTTKGASSWKNRSKTYRFNDNDAQSEIVDRKITQNQRHSIEVKRRKYSCSY